MRRRKFFGSVLGGLAGCLAFLARPQAAEPASTLRDALGLPPLSPEDTELQRKIASLQFFTGGQVSATTGLRSIGLDWRREQERIAEEAKLQQECQARCEAEMAAEVIQPQVDHEKLQELVAQAMRDFPPAPPRLAGQPIDVDVELLQIRKLLGRLCEALGIDPLPALVA